jgi:prepilin-type N-terminal cleavage/methylation domain-containing protein
MRTRPGFTLIELALVLIIAGVLATFALTSTGRARHGLAVRSARAELASAVSATRSAAILAGGATLVIDVQHARAWIETAGGTQKTRTCSTWPPATVFRCTRRVACRCCCAMMRWA